MFKYTTLVKLIDKWWKRLIIVLISPLLLCLASLGVCLWFLIGVFDMLIYGIFMWIKTGEYKNFFIK